MVQSKPQQRPVQTRSHNTLHYFTEKIVHMWNCIRQSVIRLAGDAMDEILFFFEPDAQTPNESEDTHRIGTVHAIQVCLGEDPARTLLALSPQEREIALTEVHLKICEELGMDACLVSYERLNGFSGLYSFQADTITINIIHIKKQPMSLVEAKELLGTLCHETYHAFQHRVIHHPGRYGISKAEAKIWKINFENYITAEQNPEKYLYQPVEISAYMFESTVMKRIYEED